MNISHSQIIESLGGVTAVAIRLRIKPPSVSGWVVKGKDGIPEGRLIELGAEIEVSTKGACTRKDIRPGDWHLIWPELSKEAPMPAAIAEVQAAIKRVEDEAVAAIRHEAGEASAEIKHVAEAVAPKDVPWDGVGERRVAAEPRRAVDRQAPSGAEGQGAA